MNSNGLIGTTELLARVPDITKRQLDYWRMIGAIKPTIGGYEPGSGHPCRWSPRDVQRLRAIANVMSALAAVTDRREMSTTVAETIWRGLADDDSLQLGDGEIVRITVNIGGAT